MKKLLNLSTWQVFALLILPAISPISSYFGIILVLIWIYFLFYCVYSLGKSLYKKLPRLHDLKIKRFYFHLFFVIIYLTIVLISFSGGYEINQNNYKDYDWFIFIIIPLHIFTMYSLFYAIWFLAKTIATIENNRKVGFDFYIREFFLLCFFPIGIWWLHPKLRKIFGLIQ